MILATIMRWTGLGKLGTALLGALTLIAGVLAVLARERSIGAAKERVKQQRKANEVRKKMDAVPDSSSDDTSGSLRSDKF